MTAAALTPAQQATLDFLREYQSANGFPPSVREIARHFNIASLNAVHLRLTGLEQRGCIARGPGARSIRVLDTGPSIPTLPTLTFDHVHRGDWICLRSGRKFWPLCPHPEHIGIEDIAHALSMKCRFTGHTSAFYSVAQHSVLVSGCVDVADVAEELQPWVHLAALLHDATEAYLPDVARPVKADLRGFKEVEARVSEAVRQRFNIPLEAWSSPAIHTADMRMLRTEQRDLMPPRHEDEPRPEEPFDFTVVSGAPPARAQAAFLARFWELAAQVGGAEKARAHRELTGPCRDCEGTGFVLDASELPGPHCTCGAFERLEAKAQAAGLVKLPITVALGHYCSTCRGEGVRVQHQTSGERGFLHRCGHIWGRTPDGWTTE